MFDAFEADGKTLTVPAPSGGAAGRIETLDDLETWMSTTAEHGAVRHMVLIVSGCESDGSGQVKAASCLLHLGNLIVDVTNRTTKRVVEMLTGETDEDPDRETLN